MNLPNKLTVLRIFLAFILMGLLFLSGLAAKVLAILVFLTACLTDYLDGKIARARHCITDFGKIMDPLADKVLVLGAFLSFVEMQLVPAWMVVIIIVRELFLTGVRFLAMRRGLVLAAESAGKHKTVSQMVTIFVILVFLVIRETGVTFSFWNVDLEKILRNSIFFLMIVTVALTIVSGLTYFWNNRKLLKNL
jgi:CDP-diacylglycerol--glycerol-3-phosphate 3-phosphatidyltransferase